MRGVLDRSRPPPSRAARSRTGRRVAGRPCAIAPRTLPPARDSRCCHSRYARAFSQDCFGGIGAAVLRAPPVFGLGQPGWEVRDKRSAGRVRVPQPAGIPDSRATATGKEKAPHSRDIRSLRRPRQSGERMSLGAVPADLRSCRAAGSGTGARGRRSPPRRNSLTRLGFVRQRGSVRRPSPSACPLSSQTWVPFAAWRRPPPKRVPPPKPSTPGIRRPCEASRSSERRLVVSASACDAGFDGEPGRPGRGNLASFAGGCARELRDRPPANPPTRRPKTDAPDLRPGRRAPQVEATDPAA